MTASTLFRRIDTIILASIALLACLLAIGDFFNLLYLPWLSANLSPLTLLLVSMIGLHLIVADVTQEAYDRSNKTLLNRIAQVTSNPAQYRAFSDAGQLETYLGRRMLEARKSICDLTWKETISSGFSASDRQIAHEFMDRCISEASGRIMYQEIFVFSDPRRLEKLQRRLAEAQSGYSCRYFPQGTTVPRLQFVIIDDEEVFFFASSAGAPLASLRSKELSLILRAYFDVAWAHARPIKEGPQVYKNELAHIHEAAGKEKKHR